MTLREMLPREFFQEFMYANTRSPRPVSPLSPAAKLLDVAVVKEHSSVQYENGELVRAEFKPWPGPHQNVHTWWELANGKAVAWNENPGYGWSFPVIKYRASEVK